MRERDEHETEAERRGARKARAEMERRLRRGSRYEYADEDDPDSLLFHFLKDSDCRDGDDSDDYELPPDERAAPKVNLRVPPERPGGKSRKQD